jgi:hypothetical protein
MDIQERINKMENCFGGFISRGLDRELAITATMQECGATRQEVESYCWNRG